jgi:bifunctional enzyme CysN/CysC
MIVRRMNLPTIADRFDAMICWMSETPLDTSRRYVIMHTTQSATALVSKIVYRIDIDTLHREMVGTFGLNDIGRVEIKVSSPLFFDAYQQNHLTGSFILVDQGTNNTVAAGMIRGLVKTADEVFASMPEQKQSPNVVWEDWNIPREEREARNGHKAAVIWFTGLSGTGKSTIARAVERELFARGVRTMLLDGDQLRHGLNGDLGFTPAARAENIRRAGEVAKLFFEQGCVVLCAFVSPYLAARATVRSLYPDARFIECHIHCDPGVLRERDPKGLYAAAARGDIANFTGLSAPYEPPTSPDLDIDTSTITVSEAVRVVVSLIEVKFLLALTR